MTKSLPNLLALNIETINLKINEMMALGHTYEEILKMIKATPSILAYKVEGLKQKFRDLVELGYNKDEVLYMTVKFPQLYSLNIETIRKKINFYKMINIDKVFIKDSKQLMQSVELSYARYMFYLDNGIKIDQNNYRKLFLGQKQFKNAFNLYNSDLLYTYNYNEFIENTKMK